MCVCVLRVCVCVCVACVCVWCVCCARARARVCVCVCVVCGAALQRGALRRFSHMLPRLDGHKTAINTSIFFLNPVAFTRRTVQ